MTCWFQSGLACTSADIWTSAPSKVRDPSDEVRRLRSRANRYRALTASLCDPRVIGAVKSCARELEREANRIEVRATRQARRRLRRGDEQGSLAGAAPP